MIRQDNERLEIYGTERSVSVGDVIIVNEEMYGCGMGKDWKRQDA